MWTQRRPPSSYERRLGPSEDHFSSWSSEPIKRLGRGSEGVSALEMKNGADWTEPEEEFCVSLRTILGGGSTLPPQPCLATGVSHLFRTSGPPGSLFSDVLYETGGSNPFNSDGFRSI